MAACTIVIAGLVDDEEVYRCGEVAQEIREASESGSEVRVEVCFSQLRLDCSKVLPMLEPDWEVYLNSQKSEVAGRCIT